MINRFVEKIQQEVDEETTTASISYLPGAFSSVRSMVRSLSRLKKQWGVDVVEGENGYKVMFEDALVVEVPKESYDEFNRKVVKVAGVKMVDLSSVLNEAIREITENKFARLYTAMTKYLKGHKNVTGTLAMAEYWMRTFPKTKIVNAEEKSAINVMNFDVDSRKFIELLKSTVDLGTIDMMIDAFEGGRQAPEIEGLSHLIGVKLESVYNTVPLVLEMYVDSSLKPIQSVYVDDEEVLDEIDQLSQVRAVYRRVFPVGSVFTPGFFGGLKQLIDDVK